MCSLRTTLNRIVTVKLDCGGIQADVQDGVPVLCFVGVIDKSNLDLKRWWSAVIHSISNFPIFLSSPNHGIKLLRLGRIQSAERAVPTL